MRSDKEYIKVFGSAGPPIDAVNALHRYRDAIVVASALKPGRPTVKGVALFPLPDSESARFRAGKLHRALNELGVGALPFTPRNIGLVEEWLIDLLSLPSDELAKPGPPFLALEHTRLLTAES